MTANARKLFDALEFAVKAHHGQFRKGTGIPYVTHPINVGTSLLNYGFPSALVIAGFLHDTLEDTKTKEKDICKRFGERVLKIVLGATEPEHGTKPWRERKEHTVEHLKSAQQDVVIVSCADKLDNIRSLIRDHKKNGERLWKRFNAPKEDQKWYYQSLAKVFKARAQTIKNNNIFMKFESEVTSLFGS